MNSDTMLRCEHYRATVKASFCALRQTTTGQATHGGNRRGAKWIAKFEYVPGHLAYCASGVCEQGGAVLVALGVKRVFLPPRPKKPCGQCGEWMTQQIRESRTTFDVRRFCGKACNKKARAERGHTNRMARLSEPA